MGLEDEARRLAEEKAAQKTARAEQEAKEQARRALEETPAPPEWTAELISIIEQRFPDYPVYRVVESSTVYDKPRYVTSERYEQLGWGWGLHAHYSYRGWNKVDRNAVLLRDGNLYSGESKNVGNTLIHKQEGLPVGTKAALIADKLLTHVGADDSWRGLFGLGAATAIMAGEVQVRDGVLSWYNEDLRGQEY